MQNALGSSTFSGSSGFSRSSFSRASRFSREFLVVFAQALVSPAGLQLVSVDVGFHPCNERTFLDGDSLSFQSRSTSVPLLAQPIAKNAIYTTNTFDRLAGEWLRDKSGNLLGACDPNHVDG